MKEAGRGDAPCISLMTITKFRLVDRVGNTIAHGEIDSEVSPHDESDREGGSHEGTSSLSPRTSRDIYRVFSDQFLGGCREFKDTAEIFAACGGCAIQPEMFQTPAGARQWTLFQTQGGQDDGESRRERKDPSVD